MTARIAPCRKCGNRLLIEGWMFAKENGESDTQSGYTIDCATLHMPKKGWDHICRNSVHGKDKKQARARWNYLQTVERPQTGRRK